MDLFISLALLLALAILLSAWQRDKITDAVLYRKAVKFFAAAVIVHNPVIEFVSLIPVAGIFFAVAARIVAYVLLLISFYAVCRAWGAPVDRPYDPQQPPRSL